MRDSTSWLRYTILASGALLALLHQLTCLPEPVDLIFFGLLIAGAGIPHGALDHFIESMRYQTNHRRFSMQGFLLKYLLQMGMYGALWYLFPALSLWLFLLISAWHFGESDTEPAPSHILWSAFKWLLGAWVLLLILLREPVLTADIMARITQNNAYTDVLWQWAVANSTQLLLASAALLVVMHAAAHYAEPVDRPYKRWLPWLAVITIVYFLPLLPAFALYFGGWHALNTFRHMRQYLGTEIQAFDLWRKTLPFTALAAGGLVFVGFFWWQMYQHIDPLPVLFVFIAIITLPHLLVMTKMFNHAAKRNF